MAFKVTSNHWEILVNYMELYPDLARGRINGPSGKDKLKKLWAELANQLNAAGLGVRTVQKWQKTWTDFKYILKKKAADIKTDINDTGGGPEKGGILTDFEIRILNILGETFHEGIGRVENGCSFMNLQAPAINQKEPTSKQQYLQERRQENSNDTFEPSTKRKLNESDSLLFENDNTLVATPLKKRPLTDHNYIRQPSNIRTKLIKPENEMEIIYKDTLSELKNINSTLKEFTNIGRGIEAALNKLTNDVVTFTCN